jgi:large subunit ribosomal protein L23
MSESTKTVKTDLRLVLKPRLSEKAYGLSQLRNTYVVDVPGTANKHTVARAIESQFDVKVIKLNLTVIKGKAKRTVKKNGKATPGRESNTKKAYVTLLAGQSLPFFNAIEEEQEKQTKTSETLAKAAEKIEKKEKKTEKAEKRPRLLGGRKKKSDDEGKSK